jgi:hypothetical protein
VRCFLVCMMVAWKVAKVARRTCVMMILLVTEGDWTTMKGQLDVGRALYPAAVVQLASTLHGLSVTRPLRRAVSQLGSGDRALKSASGWAEAAPLR